MAQAPNPFEQQTAIPGVKKILAVGAGKGGVGKSTVAANLALSLQHLGLKVGLLDADVYGPSVPRLFGALQQKPEVDDNKVIQPIERLGLKLMSIGFLVDEDLAVVWRGPMLFKAMNQFISEVNWKDLDVLIVDLPPGTGDVQLSLVQKVPLAGAVMVSTPQNLALSDVKKAVDMFDRTGVPILGLAENMSYLMSPQGERLQLFPKGEMDQYLDSKKITKLAEIPFDQKIGLGGETGLPVMMQKSDSETSRQYMKMAETIAKKLELL